MSCLPLPKGIKHKIDSKFRDFFWKGTDQTKKQALIKRDKICRPKELGGLGIKNPSWKNEALGGKLVWRMYNEKDSKWAKILHHKYLNCTAPYLYLEQRIAIEDPKHGTP